MKRSGEITVFLSMCTLCVWALLCVMLESARTAGSRYYFQVAAGSGLDTLFSRYHRRLWEEYRIFALEYGTEEEIIRDLEGYINEYLSVNNWYPAKLESVDVTQLIGIADDQGSYLAEEVLEFMKAGAAVGMFVKPEEGERFLKDVTEGGSVHELSKIYDDQGRQMQKLEQAAEKLIENMQEQERMGQEIEEALEQEDGQEFFKAAKGFRRAAEKYAGLMRKYEKQALALADSQQQAMEKIDEVQEDLQENREALFRQRWNPYDDYIAQDGDRRKEFALWEDVAKSNLMLLEETEMLVQEDEGYTGKENGSEEDSAKETEESLKAAAALWKNQYIKSRVTLKASSGDREKQNLLEQVKRLTEGGLLELVMPEGTIISSGTFTAEDMPSQCISAKETDKSGSTKGSTLPEQVLINEYCGYYFTNALSTVSHPIQYELEYLLHGALEDRENLEKTLTELLAVREGMNLIHILSDAQKRNEAKALALIITGAAGLTPLVEITACIIMGIWALGESIQDLRILMAGGKVPLWKQKGDWNTELDNILSMGRGQMPDMNTPTGQQISEERGFSYEQYLKLLLLKEDLQAKHLRMLDLIQMNIRWQEPGFYIKKCAYRVDICGRACGKHLFFALPIVENLAGKKDGYDLEASGEKAY